MNQITIKRSTIESIEVRQLMSELSNKLRELTGSSGQASFSNTDVMSPRSICVVAEVQGQAVGCATIRPINEWIGEVKRMYSKRKGVGTKLLQFLEEEAMIKGYTALRLETRIVNTKAVQFYKRNGYVQIPNYGIYEGRRDAICFEKQL